MNVKDIENLIKFVQKSGVAEVSIEQKDFKITIRTSHVGNSPEAGSVGSSVTMQPQAVQMTAPAAVAAPPVTPAAAPASPAPPAEGKDESKYVTIKSPMIGTFYRSSAPDKPPYVNVGDDIKQGSVLCIIEAMKLFNEIECEQAGRIVKVLVDNATPVEYDQPLFLIEPF